MAMMIRTIIENHQHHHHQFIHLFNRRYLFMLKGITFIIIILVFKDSAGKKKVQKKVKRSKTSLL